MITLSFLIQRETMHFFVKDKQIFYTDRLYKGVLIRCIPKDENFMRAIINSRNKLPQKLISMFNLSEEDQKEYDNAKSDEELADIVIRDCKDKGARLIQKGVIEDGNP
jgi:hypothetical protein